MRFVCVTAVPTPSFPGPSVKMWINAEHILAFSKVDDQMNVAMVDGSTFVVEETVEDLLAALTPYPT